jgi:hypothetical protein
MEGISTMISAMPMPARAPAGPHRTASQAVTTTVMLLVLSILTVMHASPDATAQTPDATMRTTPVLAYYYIWFAPESWNRAKVDLPLLGPYASDDEDVMRLHVQWAKASGIDGFIVSWKDTETLSRRLDKLVQVAEEEDFKLSIIYEGLDFWRHPLPTEKIDADLSYFTETYGDNPVFDMFGRPVVVWSGTWEYSRPQIESVTLVHRPQLQILASEKQTHAYDHIADLVDGNAYYWSSVDPDTYPDYPGKLERMSTSVHNNGGLWIAPAAPGFDARHLGGEREVTRKQGEVLETQMKTAMGSDPDAIGLISWNEFSENSHVEPSCEFGDHYLAVLAQLLGGTAPSVTMPCDEVALATAQAGAEVGPPGNPTKSTPSASPLPPQATAFDWDSSAPSGSVDRSARVGIVLLLGLFGGLMIFSILKVVRRALGSPVSITDAQRGKASHQGPAQ